VIYPWVSLLHFREGGRFVSEFEFSQALGGYLDVDTLERFRPTVAPDDAAQAPME